MTRPFRRRVLYIPGYDPIPPRRYRELYRREGAEQARISGYGLAFGSRRDRTGFGWGVTGDFAGTAAEAEFEVLVWADIVQGSMGQGILATYGQLFRTAWAYVGSGALFRLMRLRRGPVIAALYPVAVLLAQLLASALAGALVGWALGRLTGFGWWLGGPVALALTWAGLHLWRRIDGKIFAWYLMHDYAFTAQDRGAYPPALKVRLARFADRIAEVLAGDWDEVLVVGHSSGAYLGVSVLAELIRSGRVPAQGPRLSYLSLGHVVPMASFLPHANRLRADLRFLSARGELDWIDVTAPGDACCFGLCDPVAVSGVEPPGRRHPLVLSAAFTQTLSPQKRRALRRRWFRLHFQYLCAFDRPGDYDYFAITAGPLTLGQRFAGRSHSPGRIARAVNRWCAP
ncbi:MULTISPECIES: hypothetical protein [Paracoccus]|uniref:Uncharacterized protein n=1 Tax=Paracoccus versutus TaxID=34007 RepID=A0A3D9XNZ1_PARVE|nr:MULTISPECIES: hypothetical protein [Paracoccus]REF72134.1 hypothetical protein BDD41_0600 [Paracoccus versutus]WGR55875.1 hypothetical protein E3U25_07845 [Paracoccus versutus]